MGKEELKREVTRPRTFFALFFGSLILIGLLGWGLHSWKLAGLRGAFEELDKDKSCMPISPQRLREDFCLNKNHTAFRKFMATGHYCLYEKWDRYRPDYWCNYKALFYYHSVSDLYKERNCSTFCYEEQPGFCHYLTDRGCGYRSNKIPKLYKQKYCQGEGLDQTCRCEADYHQIYERKSYNALYTKDLDEA